MQGWKEITNVKNIGNADCGMVETSEFLDSEIYVDNEEDRDILESVFHDFDKRVGRTNR